MDYTLNNKTLNTCLVGTWSWGKGSNGSKMVFGQNFTEDQLRGVFENAYKAGFTAWDTAEVYGMGTAESLIGGFIKDKPGVFISTKHFPGKKYKEGETRQALEASLKRLGIPKADLYFLHSPKNIEQNMKEMAACYKDGLIGSIGLSNGDPEQIALACKVLEENGAHLDAIQNHYSLLAMEREETTRQFCKEHGIIFFGYMLLEQGALSGHYDSAHHFETFSMRGLMFGRSKFRKAGALINYIRELGTKYNIDPSQIAIAWGVSKGIVPIVGINKPRHVEPLAKGLSLELGSDEISRLEELALASGIRQKGMWE